MEETAKNKWYDKKALVIILLIIFFPVGLYALWKNNKFSMISKGVITVIVAFFVVIFALQGNQPELQEAINVFKSHRFDVKEPGSITNQKEQL